MNYCQILKYLENTSYKKGIKLGLNRIKNILDDFGSPQNNFKSIHIAGTNGKGSAAIYLSRLLESFGYKTGLYTSPHLQRYTERISINQKEITKNDFSKYLTKVIKKNKYSLTEFEILTSACILYFSDKKVDFAVMETGLGGKYDATNILTPVLTIITNVSFDHMGLLGDTLNAISKEKAGIIKEMVPLITAENKKSVLSVFKKICAKNAAPLIKLAPNKSDSYHTTNAGLSLKAFKYMIYNNLIKRKPINISSLKLNNIPGRFEEIKKNGIHIILDSAHNEDGLKKLKIAIKHKYPNKKIILIMGALKTKDIKKMIKTISPITDTFIATKGKYYLFREPEELVRYLPVNKNYFSANNVKDAFLKARKLYKKHNIILIAGSFYLIGEAKDFIKK